MNRYRQEELKSCQILVSSFVIKGTRVALKIMKSYDEMFDQTPYAFASISLLEVIELKCWRY